MPPAAETPQPPVADAPGSPTQPESRRPPPAAAAPHRNPGAWAARTEALQKHPHREFLEKTTDDALDRLLVPSLEREIRRELKSAFRGPCGRGVRANLRGKLLAPPLRGRRVLAVDPGFRTGCKLAVLDETGNLLEDGVVYPHTPPQARRAEGKIRLEELIRKHQVQVIAIGNGTACRETEEVISELIADLDARRHGTAPEAPAADRPGSHGARARADSAYAEAAAPAPTPVEPAPPPEASAEATPAVPKRRPPDGGAAPAPPPEAVPTPSADGAARPHRRRHPPAPDRRQPPPRPARRPARVGLRHRQRGLRQRHSASPVGREEFPNFDATLRGTISIGRRLQDPLSELVKIDPQHVGVGLYQHDVSPKQLRESLDGVVESCVNSVGVDLNTASVPLLRHVSGLNQMVARDLVEHRKNNGPFKEPRTADAGQRHRRGAVRAGRRLPQDRRRRQPARRHLDSPGKLPIARQVLTDLGFTPEDLLNKQRLDELRDKLKTVSPEEVASRLQAGVPTVADILDALARPGRDPREDLPPPIFKKGVLKLEDLQPGMELKGTVLNVVDFGAFIDIGLKDSGLVHISQMANRYVKSPYDVAAVGDVVTVWVLAVDKERRRVSLTMIAPGTERKPPERKPQPQRREGPPPNRRPPQGQEGRRRSRANVSRRASASRRAAAVPNRAGDRSTAVVRRRAAIADYRRAASAVRCPVSSRAAAAPRKVAGRGRSRETPRRRRPSNRRLRASRARRRPSRTCRRRPWPGRRRSAPSPNWPRSGTRKNRKRRRRPRRRLRRAARKANRRRHDGAEAIGAATVRERDEV